MSVTMKSIIFLALTFAISWTIVLGGWALGAAHEPRWAFMVAVGSMFGPSVAAVVCAIAFEKGRRRDALGLRFGVNLWWLWAWVIALTVTFGASLVTVLAGKAEFVDISTNYLNQARAAAPEQAAAIDQAAAVPGLSWILVAQAALLGGALNTIALTLSEELGWRGYLYGLWRRFGFTKYTLATGAIWGVWHAPLIFFFGLNYPDHGLVGIPLFILFCTLYAFPHTLVRDRGKSVIAAAVLHGTGNALGGVAMLGLSSVDFPWAGVVGIGGFVALAVVALASWALGRRDTLAPAPASA
ncbi:MAG: CPBP family intramembrane glutamic endopeptidase [Hyphomonadaceae bacterium]